MPLATPASPNSHRSGGWIDDPPPGLDIPFDRYGRRLIEAPDGSGELLPYWRASKLGEALETYESKQGLIDWEKRAVFWSAGRNQHLVRAASAYLTPGTAETPEDRAGMNKLVKDALNYAKTSTGAIQGTALHKISEHIDAGHPMDHLDPVMLKAADMWRRMTEDMVVHLTETFVVCDEVRGAGTFDRLGSFRRARRLPGGGTLSPEDRVIVDLKSNKNRKYWGKVYSAQQGTYVNGVPYRPGEGDHGRLGWPDGIAPRADIALIPWVPINNPDDARWVVVDIARGFADAVLAMRVRLNANTGGQFVDCDLEPLETEIGEHELAPGELCQCGALSGNPDCTLCMQRDALRSAHEHELENWRAVLLAHIEQAPTVDALVALHTQASGTQYWTDTHSTAATARAAELAGQVAA